MTYVDQMRQAIATVHALRAGATSRRRRPDDLLEAFRAWKRGEPIPET